MEREKTPERGAANKIGFDISYDVFDKWCHNLDGFNVGGEIASVDTTDFSIVNFHDYFERAKCFLS